MINAYRIAGTAVARYLSTCPACLRLVLPGTRVSLWGNGTSKKAVHYDCVNLDGHEARCPDCFNRLLHTTDWDRHHGVQTDDKLVCLYGCED